MAVSGERGKVLLTSASSTPAESMSVTWKIEVETQTKRGRERSETTTGLEIGIETGIAREIGTENETARRGESETLIAIVTEIVTGIATGIAIVTEGDVAGAGKRTEILGRRIVIVTEIATENARIVAAVVRERRSIEETRRRETRTERGRKTRTRIKRRKRCGLCLRSDRYSRNYSSISCFSSVIYRKNSVEYRIVSEH